MVDYSFIRKYFFVIIMVGIGQPSCLFSSEEEKSSKSWMAAAWEVMSHPVVAPLIYMAMKPVVFGIEHQTKQLYLYYWLTPEEREKLMQEQAEQEEHGKIAAQLNAKELELRRDPRWKDLAIQQLIDNKELRQHRLAENKILLAQARRKEEEEEIQHLNTSLQCLSLEEQNEAKKQLDNFIKEKMKSRMSQSMNK